jgi:hypothetical protein
MSYEEQLQKNGFKNVVSPEVEREICLFFANSCLDEKKREELIEIFKKIHLDTINQTV